MNFTSPLSWKLFQYDHEEWQFKMATTKKSNLRIHDVLRMHLDLDKSDIDLIESYELLNMHEISFLKAYATRKSLVEHFKVWVVGGELNIEGLYEDGNVKVHEGYPSDKINMI
jgi:hypothetical protein